MMMNFIGKYDAKSDVKGRVFIPANYRKMLLEDGKEQLVVRKDTDNQCLIFYPPAVWEAKVSQLKENLDEWDADDQILLMQFVSIAEILDIDSQGRVLVSKRFFEQIGSDSNEVVFVGMMDRFALWSRDRYEQTLLSADDFAERIRIKMRKKDE